MSKRKFSQQAEIDICREYNTPLPNGNLPNLTHLGQKHGCSSVTVANILKRHRIKTRKSWKMSPSTWHKLHQFSLDDEQKICDMYMTKNDYDAWHSLKSIAGTFGCSPATIGNILKRQGVKIRGRGEANIGRTKNPPPLDEPPPLCKCGCGHPVKWNPRVGKDGEWYKYVKGHYNPPLPNGPRRSRQGPSRPRKLPSGQPKRPHYNHDWLVHEYHDKQRTAKEIAAEIGVTKGTILNAMRKLGIPRRTTSESLKLRGSMRGSKNPAWKGGVADWDYSHDWKSVCKIIKDRDNWTCQLCGECRKRWGIDLHVHHIDENKLNNHPHNLISLCNRCHKPIHGYIGLRRWLVKIAVENSS